MGDFTPTRDRGQGEVKRSRRNFRAGQAENLGQLRNGQELSKRSMGVVSTGWSRVKGRFFVRSRGQARKLAGSRFCKAD